MNRTFSIGMPQMAVGCLSENWLLKELGSLHWDRLCMALATNSQSLTDSEGRRLYATFVRIKLSLDDNLAAFDEGDELSLTVNMSRFGRSTVLSSIDIKGKSNGRPCSAHEYILIPLAREQQGFGKERACE